MIIRLILSIVLFTIALKFAGITDSETRNSIGTTLAQASPWYLLLSYVLTIILNISSSYKWKLLLNQQGFSERYTDLIAMYYVGKFYNLLLPTSIGGDAIRAVILSKRIGSGYEATASIAAERMYGLVTLLLLCGLILLLNALPLPINTLMSRFIGLSLIALGIMFLALPRNNNLVLQSTFNKLPQKIATFFQYVTPYSSKACIHIGLSWSLFFYVTCMIMVIVTTYAFDSTIAHWGLLALMTPLILLMINIPISYAGIGILELSYTLMFDWAGLGAELGLAVALFVRFKSIVDALLGGIIQHRYL